MRGEVFNAGDCNPPIRRLESCRILQSICLIKTPLSGPNTTEVSLSVSAYFVRKPYRKPRIGPVVIVAYGIRLM